MLKNPKKIMNDALKNITQRNSHRNLISPAPSRKEMELIYQAALRAPDHAWLRPSSFIEIQGDSLKKLSRQKKNFRYESFGRLRTKLPIHTQRLALCRNRC